MKKLQTMAAFTLAEVLITLAIIGIVAAMTIPTLVANYQKVAEVAALKKAYAEITEALKLMANDYGCPGDLACTHVFDYAGGQITADNKVGNALKKYLKLAKDCGTAYVQGDDSKTCLPDSYNGFYDGTANSSNRNNMNSDFAGSYNFITADGFAIAIMLFGNQNTDCNSDMNAEKANLNVNQYCGEMVIDVNGPNKGPNNYGRDIFDFYITNGRGPAIYPNGGSELKTSMDMGGGWTNNAGDMKSCYDGDKTGFTCAGRIMEQGWQMNY